MGVFFIGTNNLIMTSEEFLMRNPFYKERLEKVINKLLLHRTLENDPRATKWANGHYTYVLESETFQATTFTLFLEEEAREIAKAEVPKLNPAEIQHKKRELGHLRIIDPEGSRESFGGYHPGYWSVEEYAKFISKSSGDYLLSIVPAIRKGIPSPDYHYEPNGKVRTHIDQNVEGVRIRVDCEAEWA